MSCQGCKQNKLVFERRGFLAGLAFMGFRVKRGLLAGAWGLMGQTVEANDMQAEQLLSALHTIALWFRRDTGGQTRSDGPDAAAGKGRCPHSRTHS